MGMPRDEAKVLGIYNWHAFLASECLATHRDKEAIDKLLELASRAESLSQDPELDEETRTAFIESKARLDACVASQLIKDSKTAQQALNLAHKAVEVLFTNQIHSLDLTALAKQPAESAVPHLSQNSLMH